MATKMKLPIIVLCIFSIVLTIGLVFLEKGKINELEELSTDEFYSEEYSFKENFSDYLISEDYGAPAPTISQDVIQSVEATKKAEEIVIKEDLSTNNVKYENEKDILAKLLYCEAGGTSWDCQVYTCSAILNLSDYRGETISKMASNKNLFSVAPWVWSSTPTQTQYEVIDYVLSGGRVSGVKWFRSDGRYHSFGTPVICIDGQYFSK